MRKRTLNQRMAGQYAILVLPGLILFTLGMMIPLVSYLFILPALILNLMFFVFPFLQSLLMSFYDWPVLGEKTFVFLDNYIKLFQDKYVRDAWLFTIKFTVLNTVIQNIAALLLALLLDSTIKAKSLFRTIIFIPCLISAIIAGFVWLRIYGSVLPALNEILGTDINFMLFGSKETVLTGLVIANNWQWVGYWMLIYLAGLQSVPHELLEAAKVDGANAVQKFLKITLPMLAPAITICVVGITTGSLKVYDLLVSSTKGGPGYASTSIIMQIYNTAIAGRQYGYGSAMSITLIAVLLLIAVIQLKWLKKREVQM